VPRYCTYPTILDEVKQISLTKLSEFGFMEPDSIKSGHLIWRGSGQEIGKINVSVDLRISPIIYLNYTYY